jgi:hypothetical protein
MIFFPPYNILNLLLVERPQALFSPTEQQVLPEIESKKNVKKIWFCVIFGQ